MTTRVVTTFWVDTFSADLVALAVGLSALAEHLEEGRWLFAGDDIHVPLNWVTSIVQSVPIPPYNKFRTVRIPRYYGTLPAECSPRLCSSIRIKASEPLTSHMTTADLRCSTAQKIDRHPTWVWLL